MAQVTATTDLAQYADQKVVLKVRTTKDGSPVLEELTGTAVAATPIGVLFKPKGRQATSIIEIKDIEEIDFAPAETKALKQKVVPVVGYGGARQHLADRHGYGLVGASNVNDMDEAKALELHNSVDHANLGHRHEDKKAAETPAA